MRLKLVALVLIALLASSTTLATSNAGHAQQPEIFEIVVPAASLNPVAGPFDNRATLRQFLGQLTVRANGAVCLTTDLTTSSSDVVMQLGLPGQASPCTTDGSVVTFNDGQGNELFVRMVLRKGTRQTLNNLAPYPPGQGQNLGPRFPNSLFVQPQLVSTQPIFPPRAGDGGLARRR